MSKEIFSYVKLKDIAEVEISGVDKKIQDNEIEVSLCNFVDVYYNWAITERKAGSFMKATAKQSEIDRFALKKGQVAITKDSETKYDIGVATYIADDFDNVILGYHCALITPNECKLSGKYLNAFFHTKFVQKYFELNATGSGQRFTLSLDAIKDMPIYLPSLSKQKEIAEIFSKIDRKIELNEAINDNLQVQMQTLYNYWFVQFDFPNEDGKPYKSSGGKMVWNEALRQNIPEAWTTQKLSSIINISNERILPSEIKDRVYVPIEVIPRKRISFYETADTRKATTGLCPFPSKAILLSNRRVYFHKVCISPFDGVTRDTVIIITPNEESNLGFIFETVFSEHFINYATKNSYGSEQPVLSPTVVMNYVIVCPNNSLDHSYSSIVNEMIDQVLMNEKENKQLLELRNLLLPLLMAGQAIVE